MCPASTNPQAKIVDRKTVCLKLLHKGTMECDHVASLNGTDICWNRCSSSHLDRQSSQYICVRPIVRTLWHHCRILQTSRLPRSQSGVGWRLTCIWLSCVSLLHWLTILLQMKWQSGVNLYRHDYIPLALGPRDETCSIGPLYCPHAIVLLAPWLPIHQLFGLLSKWCRWAVHVIAGIRRFCSKLSHEVVMADVLDADAGVRLTCVCAHG